MNNNRNNVKGKKKPYRKPKGKRASKGNYQDEAMSREYDKGERAGEVTNNPAWYATDPALLRDSASLPWSWVSGSPFELIDSSRSFMAEGTQTGDYVVPGIMVSYILPTVGSAIDGSSPLNVAAQSAYSYVRHANSGSRNYSAEDLMIYMVAWASVFSYLNFLIRAYSIATLYTIGNRYLPDGLLEAMGFNATDLCDNLAQFRYSLNILINKSSALAVPATMTYFQRQAMLYQNIYTEGESVKDQLYMYCPMAFFKFTINEETKKGQLVYSKWMPDYNANTSYGTNKRAMFGPSKSWKNAIQFGNDLLSTIFANEDFGLMSGDVLKAYGGNIIKLASIPEYLPIVPVYDRYVLEQMQNATNYLSWILPPLKENMTVGHVDVAAYPVTQHIEVGNSYLKQDIQVVWQPGTTGTSYNKNWEESKMYSMNHLITSSLAEPGPDVVIESTRLTTGVDLVIKDDESAPAANTFAVIGNIACGTEVVYNRIVISNRNQTIHNTSKGNIWSPVWMTNPGTTSKSRCLCIPTYVDADYTNLADLMAALSPFKFRPTIYVLGYNDVGDNVGTWMDSVVGAIDNYTVMTPDMLERLHETAVLNEYNVPSIAKFNGPIN